MLKVILIGIRHTVYERKAMLGAQYDEERTQAKIIKRTHSIEKGLSLEKVRPGFGKGKMKSLFDCIEHYTSCQYTFGHPCVFMALDAVKEYLDYHKRIGFSTPEIEMTEQKWNEYTSIVPQHNEKMGGVQLCDFDKTEKDAEKDAEALAHIIKNRHSVRSFDGRDVDNVMLSECIELANRCPSACNRQTTRVFIIEKSGMTKAFTDTLAGIGGFADSPSKYLLITGTISAFEPGEEGQCVVSAGIFAGYLSLILQSRGISSCVIQRPVRYSAAWKAAAISMGIPNNQQPVCLLSIGYANEKCLVPISHRIPSELLVRTIK